MLPVLPTQLWLPTGRMSPILLGYSSLVHHPWILGPADVVSTVTTDVLTEYWSSLAETARVAHSEPLL